MKSEPTEAFGRTYQIVIVFIANTVNTASTASTAYSAVSGWKVVS
jgi:hypothetical protein